MRSRLTILFLLLALVAAACGGDDGGGDATEGEDAAPADTEADDGGTEDGEEAAAGEALSDEVIRFSVGIDGAYAPVFLADQEGLFAEEGVNVEVVQFAQGGEGVDAMIAGEIQIAGTGESTAMAKSVQGDLVALAVFQESGEYVKLVVGEGVGGVDGIQRMGVVPGSVSEYSASKVFAENGIDESEIEFVQAGPPELPVLLSQGEIDGFVLWEPWPSQAVSQGGEIVSGSGDFGYVYNLWLTARGEWLADHEEEARAVARAVDRAAERIAEDPQAGIDATLAAAEVPEESVQLAVEQIQFDVRDFTDEDVANYTEIADFLVNREITPEQPDLDAILQRGFYTE